MATHSLVLIEIQTEFRSMAKLLLTFAQNFNPGNLWLLSSPVCSRAFFFDTSVFDRASSLVPEKNTCGWWWYFSRSLQNQMCTWYVSSNRSSLQYLLEELKEPVERPIDSRVTLFLICSAPMRSFIPKSNKEIINLSWNHYPFLLFSLLFDGPMDLAILTGFVPLTYLNHFLLFLPLSLVMSLEALELFVVFKWLDEKYKALLHFFPWWNSNIKLQIISNSSR